LLDFALAIARESGEVALGYFQKKIAIETKADESPVTVADRETERLLRRRIEERFADHGICGEEFGVVREASPCRWMLDPIDGTESFIRGVPLWGVMVGLEHEGQPLLGVVHFPALRESLWGFRGGGAWWQRGDQTVRAQVSDVARLERATLLMTDVRGFLGVGLESALERLRGRTRMERTWGDCYGHALVATGRAEIMLDPILSEWDACSLLPILEEAGGHFTDWRGQRTIRGGNGISTNDLLFEQVMKIVRG